MTEAAHNDAKMRIMQNKSSNGESTALKIYSKADNVYVNGKKLTKKNECFNYSTRLTNGRNYVKIKYKVNGQTYSFEYFLANQSIAYNVADITDVLTTGDENSKLVNNGEKISIKAVSYGRKNDYLDFKLPFTFDFNEVHNFGFTLKNTCAQTVVIELYVGSIRADEIALFPYETYKYDLNYLYDKVAKAVGVVDSIVLGFENGSKVPDRTLELYDKKE